MEDDSLRAFFGRAFAEASRTAAGIGMRVVVHATALACWIWGGGRYGFSFWSYIGLICLVPRGASLSSSWLLPAAIGAAQTVLSISQGMAPGTALFFGGLQTWAQRLFEKRGRMGWEWVMAPILCLGVGFLAQTAPLAAFAACAVAGAALQTLYAVFILSPALRRRLAEQHRALRFLLEAGGLPAPLEAPLRRLVVQLGAFSSRRGRPGRDVAPLAGAGDDVLARLARLKARARPDAWDAAAGKAFTAVNALNDALHARLAALGPVPPAPEDETALDPLDRFHAAALELSRKRDALPRPLWTHIDGIVAGTDRLIGCMRRDPADMAPGSRFLNRYLPAAHRVADECLRLPVAGREAAFAEARDVLERLEHAFAAERDRLLENDAMSLNAELKVLDKLLKMDGR